jgi:hypothetical protein
MGAINPPRSVGQGHVDTVTAEADDVGVAVVVDVRKLARVEVLAAPAAGAGTKGAEYKLRRPKIRRHVHLPQLCAEPTPRLKRATATSVDLMPVIRAAF